MRFSVIVPVYNVENYVLDCLNSIDSQSFDDYEIIVIDDGSTDESGRICDEYAKNNDKVRVYHKENSGLSSTRNYGISVSRGEYLVFVDSDDFIEKDSLKRINEVINEETDVVLTRLIQKYPEEEIVMDNDIDEYVSMSDDDQFEWLFKKSFNTWPAPKNIIKSEFIKRNKLKFLEGALHEDMDWTSRLFILSPHTAICSFPWYWHRLNRQGSITTSVKEKSVIDVINMTRKFYDEFKETGNNRFIIIFNRMMSSVYGIINKYEKNSVKNNDRIAECIGNNIELFSVAPSAKYRLFSLAIKIIGPRNALRVLSSFSRG